MLNYWAHVLLDYDFVVVHRPGLLMILEDHLSRMFPSTFWGGNDLTSMSDNSKDSTQNININILATDAGPSKPNKQLAQFIRERLDKKDPGTLDQRETVLQQIHAEGHSGSDSLFHQAWMSGYYWKGMQQDCQQLVSGCKRCLQFNVNKKGFHPLNPIAATLPFDHLAIDLLGPLQETESKQVYILVIVDIATRFILLRALTDKSALTVAHALYSTLTDFGIPKIIQSDNGTEFTNQTIDALIQLMGTEHRRISPYHPRANGAAESHVKLTKSLLFKLAGGDMSHWDEYLPSVQLALNLRIPERHKSTPFALMFGRAFNFNASDSKQSSKPLTEAELEQRHHMMRTVVFPAIRAKVESYNQKMAKQHDDRVKIITEDNFPPASMVMISNKTAKTGEPTFLGPYQVLRRTQGGAYQLQDQAGNLLSRDVPSSQLKPAQEASLPAEPSFEVEAVVNHRSKGKNIRYLVKWRGYTDQDNTWEPLSSFDTERPIQRYWTRRKH
jgi:transposase InsO family protein